MGSSREVNTQKRNDGEVESQTTPFQHKAGQDSTAMPAINPPKNVFVRLVRRIYHPIGFTKGYNFTLFVILLGAFFGFALARLDFLDFNGVFCNPNGSKSNSSSPGECFYWNQQPYKAGIIIHLAAILPASLLACLQFIPVVRRRAILFHRINGYLVILLSLISTSVTFMISKVSFGGDVAVRSSIGLLGILFIVALAMAYINIKRLQIEQHRAWMLRAWVYAGCIITTRIIMFLASAILPMTGTYYQAMPCDKVAWIMGSENRTLASYPECGPFFKGTNLDQFVAVQGQLVNAKSAVEVSAILDMLFGPAVWLALALHAIGIEIYLHLTPAEFERLRNISYKRQMAAGMRNPGRAGLTADQFGDSQKWTPTDQEG